MQAPYIQFRHTKVRLGNVYLLTGIRDAKLFSKKECYIFKNKQRKVGVKPQKTRTVRRTN